MAKRTTTYLEWDKVVLLIKKLEKTERIEVESDSVAKMKLTFPLSVHPGKWVLELEGLGKSYGEKKLFKE